MPVTLRLISSSVSGLSAARCRYVKSVSPSRIRGYSSAMGSLTLSTMSMPPSVPHAVSASGTILAPAETNSSSLTEDPTPASFWM